MSSNTDSTRMNPNNRVTHDVRNEHLFDTSAFNINDSSLVQMSVGAPGPDLLKYCTANYPVATEHLIVQNLFIYLFVS